MSSPCSGYCLYIKPSSKKVSGSQNDLKRTPAAPVLPVSLWTFSEMSGVATQSLLKHVLHASSWFSRSDTAFPLLSCHPPACPSRSVLARESLLAAILQVWALVLHRQHASCVAFSCRMPRHCHTVVVRVCRAPGPARNVCGHVPAAARRSARAPAFLKPLDLRAVVSQELPRQ